MKYLGIFLLLGTTVFLLFRFSLYQKTRLAECEGFLSLFAYLRREIACFARPLSAVLPGFSDAALERAGYLSAAREEADFAAAYRRTQAKLSLGKEERALIENFSEGFGKGYLEDEIRRLDAFSEELGKLAEYERRQMPRTGKLVRTVAVSLSLCAVLLLL